MTSRPAAALLLLPLTTPVTAQTAATDDRAVELQQPVLTVSAPRLERELLTTPMAVSMVDEDDIHQGQQRVRLDESLVRVPGVFIQNRDNFAQGARVSIRGFGARAPFGVRGITILVDGIPYTLPDGQAQLDAIDLDNAEQIEVIRGPAAVQYGNAAGGVISVTTADGRDEGDDSTTIRAGIGSDGYNKQSLSTGGEHDGWAYHLGASRLELAGYRDHSRTEKRLLNASLSRDMGDQRRLTAIINLLDNPRSEDPGGLTQDQVDEDRRQAGRFTEDYDTGQEVDQQVVGLQYEDLGFGPGELYLKGFTTWRDFEQQLPYPGDSLIDYRRHHFGGSAEYHQRSNLAGMTLDSMVGIDGARQEDDRHRRDVAFDGSVTGEVADETQTATSLGIFAQGDLALNEHWILSAGGRFDRIDMEIDDDYDNDGDQSGERTFHETNGSLGISYRFHPLHQVYANTSTAFETPTFSEFANPAGGGFNPDVEPQESWSRELGVRGTLPTGLDYDVTLFSIDVDDELVPYEIDGSDRTFYENLGDTSRDGLEVALGWQPSARLELNTALTLARYEFNQVSGSDLDGNRLPGLPETTWVNQLTWYGTGSQETRYFATLETQYVGDMVADNANRVDVDSYWLVNLRAGDGWRLGGNQILSTYLGIRNLFDEDHYANIRINASNDRYFEPAPDRSFYAGVELSF
ncbi:MULTISPECIES: TonB-dependent receptor [unclassified Halomonas]|uniref:TonB-dependent receptor family protein n=1 Tax=unclassified Halomonas TaxID=2609666 RepID=UPI0009FFDAB3|nr:MULTISPECIES: TonB-dependent receptor [unclassified Halomonas]MCO7217182.1 TonB-dependent receptor [Halomonas sp. OfavH-34-E]